MNSDKFVKTIRSAKHGQKVQITFKTDRTGVNALHRLSRYLGLNGFEVVDEDKIRVERVLETMTWGETKNRIIDFIGIQTLNENELYQLGIHVDEIKVI